MNVFCTAFKAYLFATWHNKDNFTLLILEKLFLEISFISPTNIAAFMILIVASNLSCFKLYRSMLTPSTKFIVSRLFKRRYVIVYCITKVTFIFF